MEFELGDLLGRKANLTTRRAVEGSENWILRRNILENTQTYYVA
jgi:hypothetical protein